MRPPVQPLLDCRQRHDRISNRTNEAQSMIDERVTADQCSMLQPPHPLSRAAMRPPISPIPPIAHTERRKSRLFIFMCFQQARLRFSAVLGRNGECLRYRLSVQGRFG